MKSLIELPSPGVIDERGRSVAVELFQQHGVLSIRNAYQRKFVSRISEAYFDQYCSLSKAELARRFAMVGDNRYMISIDISPPFNTPELYANGAVMPILTELLGDDCIISSFGSVLAFPGADVQPVHFDYPPLFGSEELCVGLPPYAITLIVPLVDLNMLTGSTAVWEGSHRRVGARAQLGELAESGSMEGSTLPMPAMGDAFLMDFRTIHAGSANQSDRPRPILYIVYSRSWFREDQNFSEQLAIDISRTQLRKVPKKYRHLFAAAQPR